MYKIGGIAIILVFALQVRSYSEHPTLNYSYAHQRYQDSMETRATNESTITILPINYAVEPAPLSEFGGQRDRRSSRILSQAGADLSVLDGKTKVFLKNNKRPHWFMTTDYSHLKMRRNDTDYALSNDGTTRAIGSGNIHELRFNRDDNFRAQVGIILDDGWKLGFKYSNYRTFSSDSVVAPEGGNIFATRTHPEVNEVAEIASSSFLFNSNIFDLELRGNLELSQHASMELYGGFRWAQIDQKMHSDYDGFDFAEGVVEQTNNSNLFGLRIGTLGRYEVAANFYAFGGAEVSLLYGDHKVNLNEFDAVGVPAMIVDIEDDYDQINIVIGSNLGVGWKHDGFDFRIGYELNLWTNLADRLVFLDDTHEAVFSHTTHDVMFDGFYMRLSQEF